MKKTKAKAAKAAKAAAASEVKVTAEIKDETESSSSKSERVSKEETDSTREMLKTIVASLNEADAAKLLRRANLLEQASDQSAIKLGEARRAMISLLLDPFARFADLIWFCSSIYLLR